MPEEEYIKELKKKHIPLKLIPKMVSQRRRLISMNKIRKGEKLTPLEMVELQGKKGDV